MYPNMPCCAQNEYLAFMKTNVNNPQELDISGPGVQSSSSPEPVRNLIQNQPDVEVNLRKNRTLKMF